MICERCFEDKNENLDFPKKNKSQCIKIVCYECLDDDGINQGHHLVKYQKRDKRSDREKIYSHNGDFAIYC